MLWSARFAMLTIEAAVERALKAFEVMKRLPRFVRADILDRAADLIERRRDEFVRLIAAEAGKPLYDARGEVSRSLFNLRNLSRRYLKVEPLVVGEPGVRTGIAAAE